MKKLAQVQAENREAIILANNPTTKSYEEALKKEKYKFGCQVRMRLYNNDDFHKGLHKYGGHFEVPKLGTGSIDYYIFTDEYNIGRVIEVSDISELLVLGLPLKLNRVLLALEGKLNWGIYNFFIKEKKLQLFDDFYILWDLTLETLEEQTEEVQREINKLINVIIK